jgi:hypothetical protein
MVNTADILLPLAPERIVVDGIVNEPAVATVTITQLAVQLVVVLLVVGYFGHRSLAHRKIPGVAYVRGKLTFDDSVEILSG